MNNKQTIRAILRIMPPVTIHKRTGIDIYLINAHQKYNEPLDLNNEQQRALDEWASEMLEQFANKKASFYADFFTNDALIHRNRYNK